MSLPHYWLSVWGIHWLQVDSLQKGPVMESFYDFFVVNFNKLLNKYSSGQWNDWGAAVLMWHSLFIEAEWPIYVSVQHTNISSDNGLSPVGHQAIIWTNSAILSIRPGGTYFGEISFKIWKFSFKEMHLKMSSVKWWSFCLVLNVFM